MVTLTQIEDLIRFHISVELLVFSDFSDRHKDHFKGTDQVPSHLQITLVSPDFTGLTRIERHRKVMDLVHSFWENGLHAMSLKLFTPGEYEHKKTLSPHE